MPKLLTSMWEAVVNGAVAFWNDVLVPFGTSIGTFIEEHMHWMCVLYDKAADLLRLKYKMRIAALAMAIPVFVLVLGIMILSGRRKRKRRRRRKA